MDNGGEAAHEHLKLFQDNLLEVVWKLKALPCGDVVKVADELENISKDHGWPTADFEVSALVQSANSEKDGLVVLT